MPGPPSRVDPPRRRFIYGSLADRAGKPLKLGLAGLHSAWRGDYRVIYRIDDDSHVLTVMSIEHRSDAYGLRQA